MEEVLQSIFQVSASCAEPSLAIFGVLFGSAGLELLQVSEGTLVDNDL